jgi:hypothetical protein
MAGGFQPHPGRDARTWTFEPPPAYFIHIPKTGGISLGRLMESAYLPWDRVRLNPPVMRTMTLERFRTFRFFHAFHQGRRLLEMTGRADLLTITMVREPVERAVSQMIYLQRTVRQIPHTFTQEYLAAVAPIVNAPLEDCVDREAFAHACDSQIRTLGVMEDYAPLFKGSADATSGRSVLRPYPLPPLMDVGDASQLLANARRWLSEIDVVGTTEHYRESVLMVSDLLGIPVPAHLPRLNANPGRGRTASQYRERLPAALLAQLHELTAHDQELYAFALDRFREQWGRFQARPRRTYSIGAHVRYATIRPLHVVLQPLRRLAPSALAKVLR